MDSGFPRIPRHIAETDGQYAEALRDAYLRMIAEHATGATVMPRDIEASWSKKGRPTALTVRATFGHSISDAIVHDPDDPEPIAETKLVAASRLMRLAFRRYRPVTAPGLAASSPILPPATLSEMICPELMRRAIVHHRFGLDRLDKAFDDWRQTRKPKFEIEYRPRGRSGELLPQRPDDTMGRLRVGGTLHAEGPEIDTLILGVTEGVIYKYAANSTLRHILMIYSQWPDTTCLAIAGRRLEDVILHDLFIGCGHIIQEAGPCAEKTRLVLSGSYDTVRGY